MLNGTDTVGHTFKRAFHRVDGVTMYVFWAIWNVIAIIKVFDTDAMKIEVVLMITIGFISPFFFIMLGLWRTSGLMSALIIAASNIWFFLRLF